MIKKNQIGLPIKLQSIRNFNKSARKFNDSDVLYSEIRKRLLDRLIFFNLNPQLILDIGSATGKGAVNLSEIFPESEIIAIDNSINMNKLSSSSYSKVDNINVLLGDAEKLPIRDNCVDLVFANLLLPWCNIDFVFNEISRTLKNGGLFLFSSFGPDTLVELRRAWHSIDDYIHVHAFFDMHDIGDILLKFNLVDPVLDVNKIYINYDNITKLISDIKGCGASNVAQGKRTSLTGKDKWKSFCSNFELNRENSKLNVTIEAIFGHAWCIEKKEKYGDLDTQVISLEGIMDYKKNNRKK